jgi:hypothetical protein
MKSGIKIVILILMIFQSFQSFAQKDRDKIEALRVSFISKKLELTNVESEKFWPVYNEYNDKIKAIRKNVRQSFRKQSETMTESEAEELYQLDLKSKQAELEIHKQYGERIKTIIGVKRVVKLRIAEEEFKREMIKAID